MYPAVDPKIRQSVRYLRTADGLRLAWAEAGSGRPLVKASNWLTHLEYEWESPVWRHWMHFFASRYRFIRYDERGCGMTDWDVGNLSLETWLADLEAVIGAAKPEGPIVLLGISQGSAAALAYAVRHPERVSHLVLYGAYALGALRRDEADERRFRAIIEIMRVGFGSDNAAFRQVFTSRFIPGGTDEQIRWFNELCSKTVSPENAARLMEARGMIDVASLLPQVRTPTLVLHGRDDDITPVAQGRLLAAAIPGAEFVELDSRNHVLLAEEPAWRRFCDAVVEFTGVGG
jgi:pimeloyl-ACP methyl ester carboxylesterase